MTDELRPEPIVAPWLDVEEQLLVSTRVFDVRRVVRKSPRDGKTHDFWVIDPPDWVNIVAVTAQGELVLVEQWRHGTQEITLEIPGGMVDPGEDALQAAQRELLEETGFSSDQWTLLGVARPNPAIQSNRVATYLALDASQTAATHFDATEWCKLRLEALEAVPALIQSGRIDHAIVLAALMHAWAHGGLAVPVGAVGRGKIA